MKRLLILLPIVILCGCVSEPVKATLDRTNNSLKTLTPNVPPEYQPGVDALQKENEAASNLTGKPAVPATPIVFTKDAQGNPVDTSTQAGVAESKKNTAELERKLRQKEATIATLDTIVLTGLGLLGAKGAALLALYMAFRKRKEQVMALAEGTQDTLGKLAALPSQLQGKKPEEILAVLATLPEMVKGIHKEYQDARGVWAGMREELSTIKENWKVGERTKSALDAAREGSA